MTNHRTTSNHTRAQSVSSRTRTRSMLDGRRDDSMRRRRRVLAAIDHAAAAGDRLSASANRSRRWSRPHLPLSAPRPDWRKSMRCKQIQSPVTTSAPRSPEHRCRRICSPPTNEPPGSTPASANSSSDSPKHSANTRGASPGSAPPPTSTHSTNGSPISNNTTIDLQQQLDERDEDLAAARATNRELMARLNTPARPR